MNTRTLALLLGTSFACTTAIAQTYTIEYLWLNQACGTVLNCNEGCTACNIPDASSQLFFGTNMAWIGVPVCPHPVTTGDNAVYSNAWPALPSANHYGMLSGLAMIPLQVDSIIIRHRREQAGPQRLKIGFTSNVNEPVVEIADVNVDVEFENTVLTDLECMPILNNMAYGTFQLRVQPYQGNGGNWHLDEIRIVGSTCSSLSTGIGIGSYLDRPLDVSTNYVDVLGRPITGEPAPGVYIGAGQRRVVQLQ